jgi:hypothetical protein
MSLAHALSISGPELGQAPHRDLLHRGWALTAGWRIRPKRPASVPTATGCSVERAIRMAVLAYRRASLSPRDLPCRAALRVYQELRPGDVNAADKVVAAIAAARRDHPAWF